MDLWLSIPRQRRIGSGSFCRWSGALVICALTWTDPLVAARQHIVVVLDDSGSMDQRMENQPQFTRMQAAKEALSQALAHLPEDTEVGIARLNGERNPTAWVVPPGPVNLPKAQAALRDVEAVGGTPLGEYLKIVGQYQATLKDYPNPPAFSMTEFKK